MACLWLESNGIRAIDNISHLTELRTLYLHQNIISKIEGLATLDKLVTLNLSHNNIKKIENLGGCYSLKNLDLSHNMIVDYRDCEGIKDCPSLTSVDISENHIEYDDKLMDFFFQFQHLLCFYFKGNPGIRKIKMYRKKMINGFKKLRYLDDRPVKEIDRIASEAYCNGGPELEMEKRKEYMMAEDEKRRKYYLRNSALSEEYKAYRAKKLANMKAETLEKKKSILERRSKLRDMIRNARPGTETHEELDGQISMIDQELQSDIFEILNLPDEQVVVPPMRPMNTISPSYLRSQREREARDRELRELNQRENGPKVDGIIPVAKQESPRMKNKAQRQRDEGVVMSTDSESENDPTVFAKRAGYRKEIFKWNEHYEGKLEEMLINHMFDFIKAAREFSELVNNFEDEHAEDKFYYEITPKILQMKWADIEIKKYRIHEFTKDKEEESSSEEEKIEEFDTKDKVRTYQQPATGVAFPEQKTGKSLVNRLHEFSSSSDEEMGVTNLEELD